jgi:hypothetical protein
MPQCAVGDKCICPDAPLQGRHFCAIAKSSFMDLAVNLMVMKVILLTVTVVLIAVLIQLVLQLQLTSLLHLPINNLLLNNLLL